MVVMPVLMYKNFYSVLLGRLGIANLSVKKRGTSVLPALVGAGWPRWEVLHRACRLRVGVRTAHCSSS